MKIAFIGLPSCGKTTLAKQVKELTGGIYVPEVARMYINSISRPLKSGDQYRIASIQSQLEKELENPFKLTICDVPVYTSAIYDVVYNKNKDARKILELSNQHQYDIIFHIKDTLFYEQDEVRYQTKRDLVLLHLLIPIYNKGQNVIEIKETNMESRLEQVLENI